MAYELHIERQPAEDPEPILFNEWQDAIERTDGVRLLESQVLEIKNPETGEIIRMKGRQGNAEVFSPSENSWHPAFRWKGDSAAISGRCSPGDPSDSLWIAAASLAAKLGAIIRGDEGETYDLATGEIGCE